MTVTSVQPYWQLTFDADGDPDAGERDHLVAQVPAQDITDLVVFSHGWNSDMSGATALYDSFFAPFPGLLGAQAHVHFGYAGVIWPSMRFSDEPIPNFPHATALAEAPAPGGLDARERAALVQVFPGSEPLVDRLAELLDQRPPDDASLAEFATLVRSLTGVAPGTAAARFALDTGDASGLSEPAMLSGEVAAVCGEFADALRDAGVDLGPDEPPGGEALFGGWGKKIWDGAKELLRQATYYAMKRRAGTVGQLGLGPLLGRLAQTSPNTRIHLVGHSFGARLVSFALRGLPPTAHNVASVTLLQGAFSHYTFSGPLSFDPKGGALSGLQRRVTGPVVACHSSHDQALGVFYPLASRLAGDAESLLGLDDRWGALGHDGFQSTDGCGTLTLPQALAGPFPTSGCVSVDVSDVVCHGGPPSGAHSDICHPELASVVLRAAACLPD
ncbi:serine-threonine protein kinase [Streptomyces sp. NPDC051976]|uniref:serine-threonine protein kinase n=1 Tax=Streptomyces sp. NPDC051976 TaxID=3154947 RepID=UPI0034187B91